MRTRTVTCLSPAGLHRMAYHEWGDPGNPRVLVCVHGLTRCGRDFDRVAAALAEQYRVICPDVVGRGDSDWLPDPALYGVPQYVADMVTLLARLDVETVDWFGTSMGGLIGIALAGLPHAPVRRLLLNDIGPRLDFEGLTRIGDYVGKGGPFATHAEGVAYLRALSQSFGPLNDDEVNAYHGPLIRERNGAWALHYDPAIARAFQNLSREAVVAGDAALWRSFEAITAKVLVVRGAESDLLSAETVADMLRRGRDVRAVEVAGVGHAPAFMRDGQIALARDFFCAP